MNTEEEFNVDVWSAGEEYEKVTIGVATGSFLTIRRGISTPTERRGTILPCPKCLVPGTQKHFLNECNIN